MFTMRAMNVVYIPWEMKQRVEPQCFEKSTKLIVRNTKRTMKIINTQPLYLFVYFLLFISHYLPPVLSVIDSPGNEFGYVATTNVSQYLNLALDIRDMREAKDFDAKMNIYVNGKNSIPMTLKMLSLTAESFYANTPLFLLYKDAFVYFGEKLEDDIAGDFDGQPASAYADTLVLDLFKLNISRIEATGSLTMHVMQAYWGQLWQLLQGCAANNSTDMARALDVSVALYVGADGKRKDNNVGYMLYNLAEVVGARFGQDNGESVVNQNALETFLDLQRMIAQEECANDSDNGAGYKKMRGLIRNLYKYSNIVLVQWLLYYVTQYDQSGVGDFIELFALSLWPQVHSCNALLASKLINLAIVVDVTEATQAEVIQAIQQAFPCWRVSCEDVGSYAGGIEQCSNIDVLNSNTKFSSYNPRSNDTLQLGVIDQDIFDIFVFTQAASYDTAHDFYYNGWNSNSYTLQKMARNEYSWTFSSSLDQLHAYYVESDDLDQTIRKFLTVNASTTYKAGQRTGAIAGLIQGVIPYLGVVGLLESSLEQCDQNIFDNALQLWERGIALFVGSIIGMDSNSTSGSSGSSLYGLTAKYCIDFATCNSKASVSNLMDMFSRGAGMLNQSCSTVRSIYQQNIQPLLLIPLIQGYISNVMTAITSNISADLYCGYAFAFSYIIVPFFNQSDPSSASLIKENSPLTNEFTGTLSASKVFLGVKKSIQNMTYLSCSDVGKYTYNNIDYGLCDDDLLLPEELIRVMIPGSDNTPPIAPSPSSPMGPTPVTGHPTTVTAFPTSGARIPEEKNSKGLAWGRYTFVNEDVANAFAEFTLGIKNIYFANTTQASEIYSNTSSNGVIVGKNTTIKSLEEFSTKAYQFMVDDPIFNFFRIALFDDSTFDDPKDGDGEDFWAFENAIYRLAISPDNGNSPQLASETITVLGIWHMIAHLLYEASRECSLQRDRPDLIDSAVALWIGQEQAEGQFNSGWSMYYVAQEASKNYGFPEGEAIVNTFLMENFKAAQNLTKQCSIDKISGLELRLLVDESLRVLSLPLLQNLIFYMSEDNFQYVELYALSVIPQAISCDEGIFAFLRDSLFEGYQREKDLTPELLNALSVVLKCMRFECEDFFPSVANATENEELKATITMICDNLEVQGNSNQLASFTINNTNTMELARLDLDLLQIQLFTRAGLFSQANDIYMNGRNSQTDETGYHSLYDLAISPDRKKAAELYALEREFFNASENHAHMMIQDALVDRSLFERASRHQLSEIVFRTLQTSVTYLSVVARLFEAVSTCTEGGDGSSTVDDAVALFIGSIEGTNPGGSQDSSGKFMYALAKEVCAYFEKCEGFDSVSNQFLLQAFQDLKDDVQSENCDKAEIILNETILHHLEIPRIQSLLNFAVENEGLAGSGLNESIAGGAMVADAVLPLINKANANSAFTIQSTMQFSVSQIPLISDSGVVFGAVRESMDGIGLKCSRIGSHIVKALSVCPLSTTDSINPNITNLGKSLYVTTTDVQDKANIALDIKQMGIQLKSGRQELAEDIYNGGENSFIYDATGKTVGLRSISTFSTNASVSMRSNPLFHITVFALKDENNKFGGADATMYADTIVRESFEVGRANQTDLAVDAAVALNIWMEIVNELFSAAEKCEMGQLLEGEGVSSIDGAAAYWIGDGQVVGDSEKGHLLYALAEQMSDHFGTSDGQSKSNDHFLTTLNTLKYQLSIPSSCEEVDTAREVRHNVDKLVSVMIVVQIQALIHYLRTNDKNRVRVYSHAFVPLVAGCSPSTFSYLKAELLNGPFRDSELEKVIESIRTTLSCLGILCEEVGVHYLEQEGLCVDQFPLTTIAGYKPSTDVREQSQLDLDILELDILMQMEAYEAAKNLYVFGKHAAFTTRGSTLSLLSLAISSGRSVVPEFISFKSFYANDDNYADTLIQQAFNADSGLSMTQRRAVAVGISSFMIVHMAALEALYDASDACFSDDENSLITASKNWDKAAAYIIGSLEGSEKAGSPDGILSWYIGKKFCNEFSTCSAEVPGSAQVNDRVDTLLYAGRGAIVSGDCEAVKETAMEVTSLLQIPLIQGSLSLTTALTKRDIPKDVKEKLQAEAYVYAQTLLPLIDNANPHAATLIKSQFLLTGESIPDGRQAVVSAYASSLSALNIKCSEIGISIDVNACTGESRTHHKAGIVVTSVLAVVLIAGVLLYCFNKRKQRYRDHKPEFFSSTGELNHTSDLLEKSPYMQEKSRSDAETDYLNGADADASLPEDDEAYAKAISRALDQRDYRSDEEQSLKANQVV